MEIRLIRHFATEGNLEKRYIGVTDEEIKAECVLEHTLKMCIRDSRYSGVCRFTGKSGAS